MKCFNALVISVALAGVTGCSQSDLHPSKWYLTGYENNRFIIQHDHKTYIAECFQSFSFKNKPDSTPDCSTMLEIPGIGHEIPEKTLDNVSWLSTGSFGIYTPAGDDGPQYQLKFITIRQSR
jgi:hypothetical protein